MKKQVFFCLWWMVLNGITGLASLDFLADSAGVDALWRKKIRIPYCTVIGLISMAVTYYKVSGVQFFDIIFLMFFVGILGKVSWKKLAAPAAACFTLMTLTEGFFAVAMSWISKNFSFRHDSFWVQTAAVFILKMFYLFLLIGIRKRYLDTLNRSVSPYLYILLFPCFLTVLAIRYGLHLDSSALEDYLSSFGANAAAAVFVLMAASALVFFFMLEMFSIILRLMDAGQEAAVLKSQLQGQKIYIEETKKRNEEYASFRHDMHNHLLVLSALIREKHHQEALDYTQALDKEKEKLSASIATGRLVLDILLQEKINHARRNGIQTTCHVKIPEDFQIQDMDLCILTANIMDNAINACKDTQEEHPFLSIKTMNRAGFLVIEAVNTAENRMSQKPGVGMKAGIGLKPGIGLGNMKNIAEKYQGTLEIEPGNGIFCIRVLLCACDNFV